MRIFARCFGAMAATVLLAGAAMAANDIAVGTVKSINSADKEFVITDGAGKDTTIKFGETVVINRGGTESQSDLKVGDPVNVCYEGGVFSWTAHYILVQEGDTKDAVLMHGTVKNYNGDTKEVTFTDQQAKDWTFPMGSAKVRLNLKDSRIADLKIGDNAMAIVGKAGDVATLRSLMIERK